MFFLDHFYNEEKKIKDKIAYFAAMHLKLSLNVSFVPCKKFG